MLDFDFSREAPPKQTSKKIGIASIVLSPDGAEPSPPIDVPLWRNEWKGKDGKPRHNYAANEGYSARGISLRNGGTLTLIYNPPAE